MILQALTEYYERKSADPDSQIAPEGFEWKELPFLIVLDSEGNFLRFEDTREGEGKKKKAKSFLVPQGEKKAAGVKANLLWDGPEYVLGANPRSRDDISERHTAFKDRMNLTFRTHVDELHIKSVLDFLDSNPLSQIENKCSDSVEWEEIKSSNANLSFRIEGMGVFPELVYDLITNSDLLIGTVIFRKTPTPVQKSPKIRQKSKHRPTTGQAQSPKTQRNHPTAPTGCQDRE